MSDINQTLVAAVQEPVANAAFSETIRRLREDHHTWRDSIDRCLEAAELLEKHLAPAAQPAPPHPDDLAVDRFAAEMKSKLAKAREKGRSGWETCPPDDLSRMLREHIEKGDPRDVANFAMMLWSLGAGIAAAPPAAQPAVPMTDKFAKWYWQACESSQPNDWFEAALAAQRILATKKPEAAHGITKGGDHGAH